LSENDTPRNETEPNAAAPPEPSENDTPRAAEAGQGAAVLPDSSEAAALVAADAEEKEPDVPYTVKEIKQEPGSVLRYVVEVATDQFDAKMTKILAELRKTMVIDGFRRGKAPIRLLKNRFGKDAQDDALREMSENVARQIVAKDSLDTVADPELHESKAEEGQPVELQIDIDVRPKLDVKGYTGIAVEVEAVLTTDEAVDRQLQMIREANATYEVPSEGAKVFATGDGVTVDVVVTDEQGHRVDAHCQENVFLRDARAALPAEVAAEIVGKKSGDVLTKAVTETTRTRAGKEATHTNTYEVTVKEVKVRALPALDDEFAKDIGDFENLAQLRKRILDDLAEQQEGRRRTQALDKILDRVLEQNPFDAPRKIVAAQQYRTIMSDSQRLERMGLDFTAYGLTTDDYLRNARSNSERLVKINLLIGAIAAKEKLEVSDDDVDKEIERQAQASGRKPLAVRARLEAEKRLDSLRQDLVLQKVEDFLIEKNTISYVEPKKAEESEGEPAATDEGKAEA
jgi:trigger factor